MTKLNNDSIVTCVSQTTSTVGVRSLWGVDQKMRLANFATSCASDTSTQMWAVVSSGVWTKKCGWQMLQASVQGAHRLRCGR